MMRLGYSAITWGGVVGTAAGVGSVADLFYATAGDTRHAVRDIASVGYEGTEVFDGDLLAYAERPDELLDVLAESRLELVSVYTGANFIYDEILDDEFAKIRRAARLASQFGAKRLVIGGGAKRSAGAGLDDIRRLGAGLDRAADIAAEAGLEASYHPHLGTLVEGPEALEELFALSSIAFCPDTAHLAAGGGDPVRLISNYAERIAHVHLKDLDVETTTFLPLGEGDLDFDGILDAVRASGYDSWLMVELDYFQGHPRAAAEASLRFLKDRGFGVPVQP